MSVTWFCPQCWSEMGCEPTLCRECGYRPTPECTETYEEKCIKALFHPVRDRRMTAIEILGRLRSRAAVPVLWWCFRNRADPYEGREIVRALDRIGTPECRRMIRCITSHPSVIVRREAEMIICLKRSNGEEMIRKYPDGHESPEMGPHQEEKNENDH